MKRWLKYLVPAVVLIAAALVLRNQFTATVRVAPATTGTAINAVTGTVQVWAAADIRVKAQHRAEIADLKVEAGQAVQAGDLLAVQASEELDLRIEQVRIRLEAAESRGELENINAVDLESLDEEIKGLRLAVELRQAPASRLEQALRDRRKKAVMWRLDQIGERENRRLLKNQLDQLVLQKEQMSTRAPFAGTIASLHAFKGDLVNGGQDLVRLVSGGRFVLMELTEEDYFGVRDGQPVTLRLASYPDRTFDGTVTRLEDVADAGSKTRKVVVNLQADEGLLAPGLTGEGYLVKDERPGAVLIPRRALLGNLVFVAAGGRVEVRRVQPGFLGLNQAEILEGIQPGDLVIVEDQNLLRPGNRVRVQAPAQR